MSAAATGRWNRWQKSSAPLTGRSPDPPPRPRGCSWCASPIESRLRRGSMELTYPERLEITPLTRPPRCEIRVPGSKSLTNRALVLAALASPHTFGEATLLTGALRSEDTEVMIDCLERLGIPIACDWPAGKLAVP